MELYKGAHLINLELGGRPLYIPLLVDESRAVLVDCGTRVHAANEIPSYLSGLGLPDGLLGWLLITHPDPDHCGGAGEVMKAYPRIRIACGAADERLVQDRIALYATRYDCFSHDHGILRHEVSSADDGWFSEFPFRTIPWTGSEIVQLSDNRPLKIWHVPGHSEGHLAVHDIRNRTLFFGDAIQGLGYQSADGQWVLPPIYVDTDSYLKTIRKIEDSEMDRIVGCHWPVFQNFENIRHFCSQSRQFVEQTEQSIQNYLASHPDGATLRELCTELGSTLGCWPSSINLRLAFAFMSHLERAISKGSVVSDRSVFTVRFHQS